MKNFDDMTLRTMLDPGPLTEEAQQKLNRTYEALKGTSQVKRVKAAWFNRRKAVSLAIAAVLVAVCGTAVLAATGNLLPMVQGVVRFFSSETPTNLDSLQPVFEEHNASVDQSVTDAGVTFAVENVSVDSNFINIFGRIQTKDSISQLASQQNMITPVADNGEMGEPYAYYIHGLPEWNLVHAVGARPVVRIEGTVYGRENVLSDAMNAYLEDDHTLVFARRILVEKGLPEIFTMEILPSYFTDGQGEHQTLMSREGNWSILVGVDASSVQTAVKTLQAGEVHLGQQKLDLQSFQWTPLGTLVSVNEHISAVPGTGTQEGQFPNYTQEQSYYGLGQVALRDDLGNWLYPMQAAAYSAEGNRVTEYTSPAKEAKAITLVPVSFENGGQEKMVAAQTGAKLELGSGYGYTVTQITTAPQTMTVQLMPYGPHAATEVALEVTPCNQDGQNMDEGDRMVYDVYTDHVTGQVTLEYYFDIEGEPQSPAQLKYFTWGDVELDEANAVTLPLEPIESGVN